MLKLRWPIVIERKPKAIRVVHCFHCARPFFVSTDNTRAYNYCTGCK